MNVKLISKNYISDSAKDFTFDRFTYSYIHAYNRTWVFTEANTNSFLLIDCWLSRTGKNEFNNMTIQNRTLQIYT